MSHNLSRPLLNEKGMSILSVLIAGSMMLVIGLSIASMLKNTSEIQQTIRIRDDLDNMKLIASAYLRNPDICKKSLLNTNGISIKSLEKKGGVEIKDIVSEDGKKVMSAGTTSGPSEMILEPLNQDSKVAVVDSSTYMAQLRFRHEADAKKATLAGGGAADRILPVLVTLDANMAVSCTGLNPDGSIPNPDTGGNPHKDPANCKGSYAQKVGKWQTQAVSATIAKELEKVFPLNTYIDSREVLSGSGKIGAGYKYIQGSASKVGQVFEYKGNEYQQSATYKEGSIFASNGISKRPDGTMENASKKAICINGNWTTIEYQEHNNDSNHDSSDGRG